jgi:hypothetical protein
VPGIAVFRAWVSQASNDRDGHFKRTLLAS